MTQQDHHIFDQTLHEANAWLNEVENTLNAPNHQVAYHALRGVLFAIRDRITPEEAMDMASQLPVLLRGVYFEGYQVSGKPEKFRTREEFLRRVNEELQRGGGFDPQKATEGIFEVLNHHISDGQMNHVLRAMPKGVVSEKA
ncbi:DUF2267 domain-containing protein [bacterium]|nr:DUF2267 domain-containing protein [bacterium]